MVDAFNDNVPTLYLCVGLLILLLNILKDVFQTSHVVVFEFYYVTPCQVCAVLDKVMARIIHHQKVTPFRKRSDHTRGECDRVCIDNAFDFVLNTEIPWNGFLQIQMNIHGSVEPPWTT